MESQKLNRITLAIETGAANEGEARRLAMQLAAGMPSAVDALTESLAELTGAYGASNWRTEAVKQALYAAGGVPIGTGATLYGWTDSSAWTVVGATKSGKTLTLQRDTSTLNPDFKPEFQPGGFAGHVSNNREQKYTYATDPNGQTVKVRLRKDGTWKTAGGSRVAIGRRSEFYDYNF